MLSTERETRVIAHFSRLSTILSTLSTDFGKKLFQISQLHQPSSSKALVSLCTLCTGCVDNFINMSDSIRDLLE